MDDSSAAGVKCLKVHVHLDYGRSPATWSALYRRGERMTPTSYGYEHASELLKMSFSNDAADSVERRLLRKFSRHYLGLDLIHALSNRRAIRSADIVWTHTEFEWQSLALLMRLRLLPRRPILAQSVWLWDDWTRLSLIRRALAALLVDAPIAHVLQSRENQVVARRRTHRPVAFVPFGIAPLPERAQARIEVPTGRALRILAAGNDRDRDWPTLLKVAAARPDWTFRIHSGRALTPSHDLHNVVVEGGVRPSRILESIEWADVLVTPIRPNLHASGITVALEAVSSGLRQVITGTGGLIDYLGGLVDFAAPSDAVALEAAIVTSLSRAPARTSAIRERGLTDRDYALRLARLSTALLDGRGIPESVERFEPQRDAPHD